VPGFSFRNNTTLSASWRAKAFSSLNVAASWPPKVFSCSRQANVLSKRSRHSPFGGSRQNSVRQAALAPSMAGQRGGRLQLLGLRLSLTGRLFSGHRACPKPRSIRAQCPVEKDVAVRHACSRPSKVRAWSSPKKKPTSSLGRLAASGRKLSSSTQAEDTTRESVASCPISGNLSGKLPYARGAGTGGIGYLQSGQHFCHPQVY
jgi:hypothetical protein